MSRIKYRSPELIEKRRRTLKRWAWILGVGTIVLCVGVVFLLRMERFQIRETNIEGTKIIEKSAVQNLVDSSLTSSYLWVIPKTNTFLYSLNNLRKNLLGTFPGISALDVSRNGFQKLSIQITERKPKALWCEEENEEGSSECYFVDDSGIVFSQAPYFSGNVYFVYRGKLDKENPLGARILNQQDFVSFEEFVGHVSKTLNLNIVGVFFKDAQDFDLLLASGGRIMLNKNLSYDDIYNNIGSILKSPQFSSSTLQTLDYVDMRFGNKIFFKTKTLAK